MDDLEEKLNSVLNNPQMMQQILSMAQGLTTNNQSKNDSHGSRQDSTGEPDLAMLQKLAGLAQQGNIDGNQKALLSALRPDLSKERLGKLEKAMRAARNAQATTGFLGTGARQLRTGR